MELEPVFDKVARYFSLLSDSSRPKVIHHLQPRKSVNDVVTLTGLSQSTVSRHLANLHMAGVASRRKVGARALHHHRSHADRDLPQRLRQPGCPRDGTGREPHPATRCRTVHERRRRCGKARAPSYATLAAQQEGR